MTDRITIVGTAGTAPELRTLPSGRQVANLRVASSLRRQDPATGAWSDVGTNWYSVSAWGDLGVHVAESIRQGDPVIVHGRLRIATWGEGERSGTAIEIDADALGHSLRFGTARFERRSRAAAESRSTPEAGTGTWHAQEPGEQQHDAGQQHEAGQQHDAAGEASSASERHADPHPTLVDAGAETPF